MEKKQIEVLGNGNVRVTIPLIFKIAGGRTRIFTPDSEHVEYTPIQLALARAFRWQKMIDEGKFSNIKDLAATVGVFPTHGRNRKRCFTINSEITISHASP